jgi:hypothetical protein
MLNSVFTMVASSIFLCKHTIYFSKYVVLKKIRSKENVAVTGHEWAVFAETGLQRGLNTCRKGFAVSAEGFARLPEGLTGSAKGFRTLPEPLCS